MESLVKVNTDYIPSLGHRPLVPVRLTASRSDARTSPHARVGPEGPTMAWNDADLGRS